VAQVEAHSGQLSSGAHTRPGGTERPCRRNGHPTVKPLELMRWLCRLVTPPNGRVLDPFAGSGTTGAAAALERLDYIGIEREPWPHARSPQPYVHLARARIAWWARQPAELSVERILAATGERLRHQQAGQASIDELLGPDELAA
jgi:site-specific DNA-methyltransferase (adenine-specific)